MCGYLELQLHTYSFFAILLLHVLCIISNPFFSRPQGVLGAALRL